MNSRSRWIIIAVTLALVLAIVWQRATAVPQGNLAGSSLGGAFALVDQDGKPVTDRDFAGQYRLMYFGYTFCPDVCPTDVALLARGLADFEKAQPDRGARVTPIFVTVDPERDDAAAVKAFVSAFHPRLVGLTGTPTAITAAQKTFGVYSKKVATSDPANYLVDHFAVFYLFDPDGAPIAFLPHGSTAAEVTQMLETHVR
jgi:protein SCO1/2